MPPAAVLPRLSPTSPASPGAAAASVEGGPAARTAAPSFEEVYDRHFGFVWRNLRRLGVPEASLDDAAQDVFVTIHRRLGEFEGRSALTTWIFAIVLGTARNHRRSHKRRSPERDGAAPDELEAAPHGSPERRAERAEAMRLVALLLDELDEEKREVFVLAELEQLSAPEIASLLGLNVNTVYARIRAAQKAFEAALARHRARASWRSRC